MPIRPDKLDEFQMMKKGIFPLPVDDAENFIADYSERLRQITESLGDDTVNELFQEVEDIIAVADQEILQGGVTPLQALKTVMAARAEKQARAQNGDEISLQQWSSHEFVRQAREITLCEFIDLYWNKSDEETHAMVIWRSFCEKLSTITKVSLQLDNIQEISGIDPGIKQENKPSLN